VVGIVRHQPDSVVLEAARFAERLGADLVCATVDVGRYIVEEHPDGTVTSAPVDPDLPELADAVFDPELEAHLHELLDAGPVSFRVRALAGDPARALGRLADRLDADAIVVGTRNTGIRASVQEFFSGSVAVHLAHRQHRSVIVIPLTPVEGEGALPWENQL
jgi:Universal stress protein family.